MFPCIPVPYCFNDYSLQYSLKSLSLMPPALFFFLTFSLAIRGLLQFHINFKSVFSTFVKNSIGIMIGIALNLQIAFGSIEILTTLILSIHKYGIHFHLFMSPSISFINVLQFSGTFLAVQCLRLLASAAGGVSLIPGQGIKIPHAARCGEKKKKL